MTNTALVVTPNSDITTRYISAWAEQTVDNLKSKKLQFHLIAKDRATKDVLESMIKKHEPRLVFLNGHGSANSVCGQDDETLVEGNSNEGALKGTVPQVKPVSTPRVISIEIFRN